MCTRVFSNQPGSVFTTGRNMDWNKNLPTQIYMLPKGALRKSMNDGTNTTCRAFTWESQYDSVVAMVVEDGVFSSADGMNSEGLAANVLYQSESQYAEGQKGAKGLDVLRWVQYVLDNCATVAEVVEEFENNKIVLVPAKVPGDGDDPADADLQLSVSDRSGDSAILEVLNGENVINRSREYRIMTNDPNYATQITLNDFWTWQWNTELNKHPSNTLPGSPFSPDRFARAAYYINHVQTFNTEREAVAQNLSILAASSVPQGYRVLNSEGEEEPNISTTLWSAVSVPRSKTYYFHDSTTPNIFWVKLTDLSKTPKGMCLHLPPNDGVIMAYTGLANDDLKLTGDPFSVVAK